MEYKEYKNYVKSPEYLKDIENDYKKKKNTEAKKYFLNSIRL